MICNFYLSVAARKIVCGDPFLRYTSLLLGTLSNQPTNKQTNREREARGSNPAFPQCRHASDVRTGKPDAFCQTLWGQYWDLLARCQSTLTGRNCTSICIFYLKAAVTCLRSAIPDIQIACCWYVKQRRDRQTSL